MGPAETARVVPDGRCMAHEDTHAPTSTPSHGHLLMHGLIESRASIPSRMRQVGGTCVQGRILS